MAIKYVLFDLDGTLTDPQEGIIKCVQHALLHYGIKERNVPKLRRFIGPPLRDSFQNEYAFTAKTAEEAIAKYRERFSTIGLFENRPYDGVVDMLKTLKEKGLKLAIASSKPEVFVVQISEKFGFTEYLDFQVGSQLDGTLEKKDEVVAKALELLGVTNKDEVVMVGDRSFDIYGAHKNGIKCVAVEYGFAVDNELTLVGADYYVENIKELTERLITLSEEVKF